eukprot:RCo011941
MSCVEPTTAELELARDVQNDQVDSTQYRSMASLWSGYGTVQRVTSGSTSVVVKKVQPPPSDGSIGDSRKRASYRNESIFYTQLAPLVMAGVSGALKLPCYIPAALAVQPSPEVETDSRTFILTDLARGFPVHSSSLNLDQTRTALRWLAGFHALFWQYPCHSPLLREGHHKSSSEPSCRRDGHRGARPRGTGCGEIAPQGSYWYLETRLEEFARLTAAKHSRIKAAAKAVDQHLRDCPHQTLIHGDFKCENLQFSKDGRSVAAVDFQYCGKGVPSKDLAYLLHTSVARVVLAREEELLAEYHTSLLEYLRQLGHPEKVPRNFPLSALAAQYLLAVLDFYRFLLGWGTWGTDLSHTQRHVEETLRTMDGGKPLPSEPQAALLAVQSAFPWT